MRVVAGKPARLPGNPPGHLWNPPYGISCFFTLPCGM